MGPMALKLALPKLDKRSTALARARFRAWWDGAAFDEAAALAAIEAAANDQGGEGVEADLFAADEPTDPRLEALQRIWGKGRIAPGDAVAEASAPTALALSATATLGVFGPGLSSPVISAAGTHVGPLRVFEWREETIGALRRGLARSGLDKRIEVAGIDLETFSAPAEALDGLLSIDDFTHADNAARLAQQFTRALKPKAAALIETYCAAPGGDLAPAFASAFCEPHVRPAETIVSLLEEAGLRVEDNTDATDPHIALVRDGFRRLGEALSQQGPPSADAARELGWETQAWRARVQMLARRRLERRVFRVVKR